MITDHLFLGPDREVLCGLEEIRRYVEGHYDDRHLCLGCGCYLIPTGQTQHLLFHVYRCANTICSVPQDLQDVAPMAPAGRLTFCCPIFLLPCNLPALFPSHDRPIVEVHGSRTSSVVSQLSPASILLPKTGFYWRAS